MSIHSKVDIMPEQADQAAAKAAGIGHQIGDIVVWLLAIISGFAGYAAPQAVFDLKAVVSKLMTSFKIDNLFTATDKPMIAGLVAGAILAGIGGTMLYWGMKYDKLVGAIAKIGGAHLLGRGVRFIFTALGG